MKKRNVFSLILSIVLIMLLTVTLFACTPDDSGNGDNNNDTGINDDANGGSNTGNQDDDKETYTFILKDTEYNAVEGASVRINVNGADGEVKITDENGKAEFKVIKNAVAVFVEVIELPDLYEMDATSFAFMNGKTLTITSVAKQDVYTIKVVDQDGNVVEGVELQLCFGSICLENATTKANGTAVWTVAGLDVANAYASVKRLPADYSLKDGEILNETGITNYTHYDDFDADNLLVIEINKLNVVTITTGDFFNDHADIEIKLYDKADNSLVDTQITNAQGKATFIIAKELYTKVGTEKEYNYYIVVKHKDSDPRYTWGYKEEGKQDLTSADLRVNVYYLDTVIYTINVARTDTEANLKNIAVVMYNRLFEEVARANTDKKGVATFTMIPYDVYYVGLENFGEGIYNYYKIEKDGIVTHNVTINDDGVLGSQNNPVDVRYGFNTLPSLAINSSIYCKVLNPQGATLSIESNVIVTDEEGNQYTPNTQGIVEVAFGSNEQVIKIEAREALGYWGAELSKLGIPGNSELIRETETSGTETVNLVNGKHYYEFEATEKTATLLLSSSDDVKFEVEGMDTNKAVLAVGDKVIFAVIGEGEVTFNINYAPVYYDYIVNVSKEIVGLGNAPMDGATINLIVDGVVKTSGVSEDGKVVFENVQEYPTTQIKADFATIPAGYKRFYENENGYFFAMDSKSDDTGENVLYFYGAACTLSLIRDGSQGTPYNWADEGRAKASEYTVKVSSSGEAYVESVWVNDDPQAPSFYYVFLAGNHTVYYYLFNETTETYDFTTITGRNETYDAVKNVTAIKVPLNTKIVLKISTAEGEYKLRWGTSVLDLSQGDPVATGTKDNPFKIVFAQTITTPDFIQGTSLADPGVSEYYYTHTAQGDMNIQVINNNADISVFVNGNYTDISSGVFAVKANDVIEFVVGSTEGLDGVSFAVKGV